MKVIDLTRTLSKDMDTYTSIAPLTQIYKRTIDAKEMCNVSHIDLNTHIGTHVDVPYHMLNDGRKMDTVAINELIGKSILIDAKKETTLTSDFLRSFDIHYKIVMFRFGTHRRDRKVPFFTLEAIDYLHEQGIHVIGSDNVSIDAKGYDNEVHKRAFGYDMLVVTSLMIEELPEGEHNFFCLAMNRIGVEGAPCRAVVME